MSEGPATPTPTVPNTIATFEFPQFPEGTKHTFDCAEMPAPTRLDFLFGAVRGYIVNRLNSAHSRHEKDDKVKAWAAYDAATKADPLQSVVAKPDFERPAEPNFQEVYERAVADLKTGTIRRVGDGPKAKAVKDPLVATVTEVVVREVYAGRRAADPKYTYLAAKAEVGGDGVAYLNKLIDAKVEGGADRAALEKMRDERYIGPAKVMLGQTTSKKNEGLPSIL